MDEKDDSTSATMDANTYSFDSSSIDPFEHKLNALTKAKEWLEKIDLKPTLRNIMRIAMFLHYDSANIHFFPDAREDNHKF